MELVKVYPKLRQLLGGTPRTDLLTASRLDFCLTLLPHMGRQAVARMLADHDVPIGVVVRVLASPNRRAIGQ